MDFGLGSLGLEEGVVVSTILEYLFKTLAVVGVFAVAWFAGKWLSRGLKTTLRKHGLDRTLVQFGTKVIRWGMLLVGLLLCFSIFGVQMTSLAALLGAAGVAIGLALQGSLSNVASGVMMLVVRPFDVGDIVKIADEFGRVDSIGLLATRVITMDRKMITIPNRHIMDDNVDNYTKFPYRRFEVEVGVAYGADLSKAREALMMAAEECNYSESGESPKVALKSFGDSSINWRVRAWGPSDKWIDMTDKLVDTINTRLAEASLEIPFPQLDLHVQQSRAWHALTSGPRARMRGDTKSTPEPGDDEGYEDDQRPSDGQVEAFH